ncbi:MAG: Rrf2 family transcriptional regulator [Coriobacteriales bacterium]|jgi:Rrf2 family protein|nr:Rrf2 family transcriptional regulator [Coriobacteriales bacterium]
MEITRRTDYAIRLIAELVLSEGKPLSVREAALSQGVPYAFARSVQHDLARSGILNTIRGAHGGMLLAIDPAVYTLFDLIESVQGPISIAICTNDKDWCVRRKGCPFHKVWAGANNLLADYFHSVSLKELIEGEPARLTGFVPKRSRTKTPVN